MSLNHPIWIIYQNLCTLTGPCRRHHTHLQKGMGRFLFTSRLLLSKLFWPNRFPCLPPQTAITTSHFYSFLQTGVAVKKCNKLTCDSRSSNEIASSIQCYLTQSNLRVDRWKRFNAVLFRWCEKNLTDIHSFSQWLFVSRISKHFVHNLGLSSESHLRHHQRWSIADNNHFQRG